MKIGIIGAGGRQGSLLVEESIKRGYEVTGIIRKKKPETNPNIKIIEKGIMELIYDDIKDFDVIIDAFGTWNENDAGLHQTTLKHLSDILAGKQNRLLVVGGAASLYINPEHTMHLIDSPDFPDAYKPVGQNMKEAFESLQKRGDVNWTYVSPSADFNADAPRTGKYQLGTDELLVNSKGESMVSYADYAIAFIDEIKNKNYIKKRFTVCSV